MNPQEKAIFRYHNGDRIVWGDPLYLQRQLDMALGDPDAVFKDIKDKDAKVWRPALACLIANAREVFGMPPIDPDTGAGATEEDVRNALDALREFLAKKKPSIETTPSSSPSSASSPLASNSITPPPLA